ncbi:MAG: class I SAM-dependent methyltransferase, partial [Solirubrobacterales bacterium]
MPAAATATPAQIKDANTRYHDAAAAAYGAKGGNHKGNGGPGPGRPKRGNARGRGPASPFADALEIG